MKKQMLGLLGMVVIFVVSTTALIYQWLYPGFEYPKAVAGVLDARQWDFAVEGIVPLQGEWEFYEGELLTPQDFSERESELASKRRYLEVPGGWKGKVSADGYGTGTYRLRIEAGDSGDYGIRAKKMRMASRIFLNGEDLGSAGQPSLSAEGFVPSNFPVFGTARTQSSTIEIVIQVSSYLYLPGGLVQTPEFGLAATVTDRRDIARMADAIVITTLVVFGIYFAGMFRQWRQEPYVLFFSLFCLTLGMFFSIDNEIILATTLPSLSFLVLQKMLFILPYASILFFVHYVRFYLGERVGSWFKLFHGVSFVYLLLLTVLPNDTLLILLGPGIALQIAAFGFIFTSVFRNRHLGVRIYYVLLGVFFLIISWVFAMTRYQLALDSPYYIIVTLLLVVLSQSFLMTDRIREAVRRSEKMAGQLLAYDRQKDEFLAKTSHELRTPLHGIINLSASLLDNKEQPLAPKHQENIRLLHLIGRRLASLVNDILDMNRLRYGQLRVQPKPVDLYVSAAFVIDTLSISPVKSNVRLVNRLEAGLPLLWADENRLRQILQNLLENGLKYTDQGKVVLSAELKNNQLAVSVTDTGIGIPSDVLDQLFLPFFQYEYEENGAASRDGIGLGLSISKQLVELQGGRLDVESVVGVGSKFTFTLPLAGNIEEEQPFAASAFIEFDPNVPAYPNTPEAPVDAERSGAGPERLNASAAAGNADTFHILIVDDEPSNLKVAMDAVSALNHTCTAVSGGREALESLQRHKPDLILLDLMMPGISGVDVCREIRALHDLSELPVLMLTASGQTADTLAAFAAGANDILQKPFELAELKARVQSLLSMKHSSEQAVKREMEFLQAQITPHFLYNSMNALIGLSYKDVGKLRETIQNLTTYLRAKFTFAFHAEAIPLERELELVRAYLEIEQLRFGHRLEVHYTIKEDVNGFLPPLTIQPIVENAVRHGIGQKPEGGTVHIQAWRHDEGIAITVEDDGVGMDEYKLALLEAGLTGGVGVRNVNRRLQMKYGRGLELHSRPGEGTRITIYLTEEHHA